MLSGSSKTTFVEGVSFSSGSLGLTFCRGPFRSSLCISLEDTAGYISDLKSSFIINDLFIDGEYQTLKTPRPKEASVEASFLGKEHESSARSSDIGRPKSSRRHIKHTLLQDWGHTRSCPFSQRGTCSCILCQPEHWWRISTSTIVTYRTYKS